MRTHKYNATKTIVDGLTFPSKAEAARYQELQLMIYAGEISDLQLQPSFVLLPGFVDNRGKTQRGITYKADFLYVEDGQTVVEDVKGMETPVFKLKAKLFRYNYPDIQFRIVR